MPRGFSGEGFAVHAVEADDLASSAGFTETVGPFADPARRDIRDAIGRA